MRNVLIAGLVLVSLVGVAYAQPSASRDEYQRWLANFDGVVFYGTVLSAPSPEEGEIAAKITFRVERAWKGVSTSEVVVHMQARDRLCGRTFVVGRPYLIAAEPAELPVTSGCSSGTLWTRNASEFVAALGPGTTPPNSN